MKLLLVFFVALCLCSKIEVFNTSSPISIDLPIGPNGKGLAKIKIKTFHPLHSISKIPSVYSFNSGPAMCFFTLVLLAPVTWPGLFITHRMNYPLLSGKGKIQDEKGRWIKATGKRTGKHFDYWRNGVSSLAELPPRLYPGPDVNEEYVRFRYCPNNLGFRVDFTDQAPKKFYYLNLKAPSSWSGRMLTWSLKKGNEEEIALPSQIHTEEGVSLIPFIGQESLKFELFAKFSGRGDRKAVPIDLLTINYQILSYFNYNEETKVQFIFYDGKLTLPASFLSEIAPYLEKMLKNVPGSSSNKAIVLDVQASPLTKFDMEVIVQLNQEGSNSLNTFCVKSLVSFLKTADFIMAPKKIVGLIYDKLVQKFNLDNGCLVLQELPIEGQLGLFREQLSAKFSEILKTEQSKYTDPLEFIEKVKCLKVIDPLD